MDLLSQKERLTDQKYDQKEAKKSKNAELSKSLGKLEPVKFKTARDYIRWSWSVEQFLGTMDGQDESRIAKTVLDSIEHKGVRRNLEGETDLDIIISAMRSCFEHSEDIIGSTINPLMRLKNLETVLQACFNSQDTCCFVMLLRIRHSS